ncbi:MAG: hypothetical protein RMI79_07385, partial [Nitrososphaerota archaeon]|nr:hypothetical protein [Nitrososphaerota archaeon]
MVESEMKIMSDLSRAGLLVIGNPFKFMGGAPRRIYNCLKMYPRIGIETTLYIPYSHLLLIKTMQYLFGIDEKNLYETLWAIEKEGVNISEQTYVQLEKTEKDFLKYVNILKSHGPLWIFNDFVRLFPLINKKVIEQTKQATEKDEVIKNTFSKKAMIYIMDNNFPDWIVTGSFISKTFQRPLFLLLQSIPFGSLRKFVISEWMRDRYFYEEELFRILVKIYLQIIKQTYLKYKFLYTYHSISDSLTGLLSVSEVPLKLLKLDVWAYKKKKPAGIIVPGNAVDINFRECLNPSKRDEILVKKEDYAIFYARLEVEKGIFEVPFIANHLQQYGYKVVLVGRFSSMKTKRTFERLCGRL